MSDSASVSLTNDDIRRSTTPPWLKKYFVQIAIVFLAYVIAGKLGQATANIRSSNLGPVWPAYGIALAAVLVYGYRVWPGVVAGAFLIAFFSPVPFIVALGQAAATTIAAMVGTFLLCQLAHFHRSMSRLSDALGLIALGALVSAIVSSSLGIAALYASGVHPYSGLMPAWLVYWLGDANGVLLVTPLALTFGDLLKLGERKRVAEFALLLSLLTAVCIIVFSDPFISVRLHFLSFSVLPFVMWAALRLGMSATGVSVLLIATIATVETALGSGPFATNSVTTNAVLLDVFFAVLSTTGMVMAAICSEQEHAERERGQLLRKQSALEAWLLAEAAMRESKERLRLAAGVAKMYADDWDVIVDEIVRSPEYVNVIGPDEPMRLTHQQLLNKIHADDRAKYASWIAGLTPENPTGRLTYRMLPSNGNLLWLQKSGRAFFDDHNMLRRIIGMVVDVTERKLAEEAISGVNRRLLEAQERERIRIARELHDDVAQRLALLAIEIQQFQTGAPESRIELETRAGELHNKIIEISKSVQAMSHELHSSKLTYLGIVAGATSFCREFGKLHNIKIEFKSHDMPHNVPADISLCLYRVLQESLHNAVKHSGAAYFDVQLWGSPGEIHLRVVDGGAGFDVRTAMMSPGLGLTSMQERLRLVNGELSIESQPQHGTTIHARIPFTSAHRSEKAAG